MSTSQCGWGSERFAYFGCQEREGRWCAEMARGKEPTESLRNVGVDITPGVWPTDGSLPASLFTLYNQKNPVCVVRSFFPSLTFLPPHDICFCAAELVFEAGFKATKTIRIRNIGLQPLPVTAEGPGHKTFSVAVSSSAPKVSPGTTLTVAVTFRASIEGGLNDQVRYPFIPRHLL
jgi:hypothetical protein